MSNNYVNIIIKRELQDRLTDSRYVATSILCLILFLTSIILMTNDYQFRQKRYSLHKNIGGIRSIGDTPIVAKSPQPLSIIAKGMEEEIGKPVFFPDTQPEDEPVAQLFDHYGEEHHLFDLFTAPDFVYIVCIVLSLMALFVSFDAICGEKERGTLRLICANSVRRSTILLSKWLGGYLTFLIALAPAILIMLLWLTLFSGVSLQSEHWLRLAGIIGFSCLYVAIFFSLGILISTLTNRSATAFILVLFVWVIWAVGMPRVGILTSRIIKPVKPVFAYRLEKRATRSGSIQEDQERLWNMDDRYIASVDNQTLLGMHLSRISPLASYVYASTALAQTGTKDVQIYRRRVADWDRERRRGREMDFVYRNPSLEESFQDVQIDFVLLVLWNILLFMGALAAFMRYDVR